MKIRTQLLLACFILSVVPLTGVVFYSYRSSRKALENAYQNEAARLTAQMDRRLTSIGSDLDRRLTELAAMPLPDKSEAPVVDNAVTALGEVAPLLDALEYVPATPAPAPPAAPAAPKTAGATPAPPSEPIVIKMNPLPPDFGSRVGELAQLGIAMEAASPEQRETIRKEMEQKQADLNKAVKAQSATFGDQVKAAESQREARREVAKSAREAARIVRMHQMTEEQKQKLKENANRTAMLFGQNFNVPLHSKGELVGHIHAQLSTSEVIRRVLGTANDDNGEIPFVVDREGTIYTRNDSDRVALENLGILDALARHQPLPRIPNWVVATSVYQQSGVRIGAARPIGDNLVELRHTAARNFGWGVGVIALALIGILPVAGHFTRDIRTVTEGAQRIAHGDLTTRLPVKSNNEFGELATAFNRMAEDLSVQQQEIVQQRVRTLEYERKSAELEEARRFQLSMLPKEVPRLERFDIAASTQTATEVGGDYYDFHVSPRSVLSVTIGDATGHGAKAGTMVTVVKTLFSAYEAGTDPASFLSGAAEKIKRMDLGRMAMALSLARFDDGRLTVASAGMPPVLIHRAATGKVDEVSVGATPLGTLGVDYEETDVAIGAGDTVLLMSDGLPELQRADGQQLGYAGAVDEFASAAAAASADEVIARLENAATRWHGDQPPNDDITFVVVRCRA